VRRALNEEIGIQAEHLEEVYFTDLLFDKEVFDYKLSCVATTNLTAEQIEALYRSGFAKDKYETTEILFPRFPCEVSRREVLEKWTPEAAAAYAKAVIDRRSWKKLLSLVKE
jgi:ADP-ribose pyrophosphatase YjhB (NUDIX family)